MPTDCQRVMLFEKLWYCLKQAEEEEDNIAMKYKYDKSI